MVLLLSTFAIETTVTLKSLSQSFIEHADLTIKQTTSFINKCTLLSEMYNLNFFPLKIMNEN